ncbi:MAG: DHH family phosphoesterase, partial [Chloroflexi bacterium]|nr:DHH family phosphoesterase [Chloroflexota bacterium]
MRPWLDPPDTPVPDALRTAVGGHPLIAATLARRGLADPAAARAFLDPDCYTPAPPADLPGVPAAAERLERALRAGERICVWGDFDVDGQTAAALLVSALRGLGGDVTYHIPLRARESHGVKLPALREVLDAGAELLLTCDTGVDAREALEYARSRGVEAIVTDHHSLPPSGALGGLPPDLPPATALVHPGLLPPGHPLATLPGVGVAFKLTEALLRRAGRAADCDALLDLVALGIVADVAVQTGDARYLLQRGLAQLRRTARPGLLAVFERAGLDPASLTEEHIGFQLGPRLNALGRLGNAGKGVELLLTPDLGRARVLALELEGLNARRKLLTDQTFKSALAQLERDPALGETAALVLAHPEWEAGVVGIVAARLAERFHKPALLLACPPGGPARGSARSVTGCDLTAALAAHAGLLASLGGHPMAD